MPKIGVLGAGRDDEIVAWNTAAFWEHFAALVINARNIRQNDMGVLLPTENCTNRGGYISRRQSCGRDLIEQWLKQMIVVAINDGYVERGLRQLLGRRKAAES